MKQEKENKKDILFLKYNYKKTEDILNESELVKLIISAENLIENAMIFKSLTFPQDDIAKKYLQDAINIFKFVVEPTLKELKKEDELKELIEEKVNFLEDQIKNINIDF